jgi:alpha-tubulin suppressor-like RCC1 family protein
VRVPLSHVSLAAGAQMHAIYEAGGEVVSCGLSDFGQLGDSISGRSSGTGTPVAVRGLTAGRVVALTSSYGDAGALLADGSYYDWGYNRGGQLGDGTTTEHTTAVHVSLPAPVKSVFQGGSMTDNGQTIALLSNGQLWEWGSGHYGQLGDGRRVDRPTPFRLTGPRGVRFVAVNSGGGANYAIDRRGGLWAWGLNFEGELGDGSSATLSTRPVRDPLDVAQVSSTANVVVALGHPDGSLSRVGHSVDRGSAAA